MSSKRRSSISMLTPLSTLKLVSSVLLLSRTASAFETFRIDATANFEASTESTYDHEIQLNDALFFHWNDMTDGSSFEARLIHTSASGTVDWLGIGVAADNSDETQDNDTILAANNPMMIGVVTKDALDVQTNLGIGLYTLSAGTSSLIQQQVSDATSTIIQHDADTGTVITDLSVTHEPGSLQAAGVNMLLVAIGSGVVGDDLPDTIPQPLSEAATVGVILLDLEAVRQQVVGGTTTPLIESIATTSSTAAAVTTEAVAIGAGTSATTPATTVAAAVSEATTPIADESTTNNDNNDDPPANPDSGDSSTTTIPIIHGNCGSDLLEEPASHVALTPTLEVHYKVLINSDEDEYIQFVMSHTGKNHNSVWMGLGFSTTGTMIGSTATIALPGGLTVQEYELMAQNVEEPAKSAVPFLVPDSIEDASRTELSGVSLLSFSKPIDDGSKSPIILNGKPSTILYAIGTGSTLGYHEHRGIFQLDLGTCGGNNDGQRKSENNNYDSEDPWKNTFIFVMHGFFGTIAWALATPLAITMAWFRTLVPTSWIYVHVFSNILCFVMTFLAVCLAVGGVGHSKNGHHFATRHGLVGGVLMVWVTMQVLNGFLRPPVGRKAGSTGSSIPADLLPPPDTVFGCLNIPRTPRESWHLLHRTMGLSALGLGVHQIFTGLYLFDDHFQTKTSLVPYYWAYILIVLLGLIGLKLWVRQEELEARQGIVQAVRTNEPPPPPQIGDEDYEGTYKDSDLVPVGLS